MIYDSPKAAHFAAFKNGVRFGENDKCGLEIRWLAANQTALKVHDMRTMSISERVYMLQVCSGINASMDSSGIVVQPDYNIISGIGE